MEEEGRYTFGEIDTSRDAVSLLLLSLDGTVDLEQVIRAYGSPSRVGGFYYQGEVYGRSVAVVYDQGIILALKDEGWPFVRSWRLAPRNTVGYIAFFVPSALPGPIQKARGFGVFDLDQSESSFASVLAPWEGFIEIPLRPLR